MVWADKSVRSINLTADLDFSDMRLTVDHAEDLALVRTVYESLGPMFSLPDLWRFLEQRPELLGVNAHHVTPRTRGKQGSHDFFPTER
jgi:spore coat polysaccharide biosynthesis protein SpsF (cytidylyltransferase family)